MKAAHVLAVVASLLVIVGLVAGFTVVGPPSHARDVAIDQKRVDDLKDIASRVRTRYQDTGEFPATLPAAWANDPVTRQPYVYRRIDRSQFMLCATFVIASEGEDNAGTSFWSHGPGRKCYTLDWSTEPVAR